MRLHAPSPPQGKNNRSLLFSLSPPYLQYSPPQGIGIGAVTGNLLLDVFPGAEAAYSLRLLRTAYFGPAIRVVRTSDDAEQDIGFLADGDLDVPELETFVGASDGLVTIQYDQVNGFDLEQTDQDMMPKIIVAGTLQITNGRPAMAFDGIDDVLVSSSTITSPADNLFTFSIAAKLNLGDSGLVFNLDSPNTTTGRRCFALVTNLAGTVFWDAGDLANRLSAAAVGNNLDQNQWTLTKAPGTDNQVIRRDGVQLAQKTALTLPTLVNNISLGNDSPTGGRAGTMNLQEFVFYDSDQLANIVGIENNQINYWILSVFTRIAENGDIRIAENGDIRVTE